MSIAGKTQNIFEALGREVIRAKHEQKSMEEFDRFRMETALSLRVIADCLDGEVETRIQGFLKDGTFSASHQPNADYDLVRVEVKANPYPGSVFRIPHDIKGLLLKVIKMENKICTQKAVLSSLTNSALYKYKSDRNMSYD